MIPQKKCILYKTFSVQRVTSRWKYMLKKRVTPLKRAPRTSLRWAECISNWEKNSSNRLETSSHKSGETRERKGETTCEERGCRARNASITCWSRPVNDYQRTRRHRLWNTSRRNTSQTRTIAWASLWVELCDPKNKRLRKRLARLYCRITRVYLVIIGNAVCKRASFIKVDIKSLSCFWVQKALW